MTDRTFGSGVLLDENFDFEVGNTGDLQHESGVDELEKDLAMQMVISLSQYLGEPGSGNVVNKIAGTAARVALLDSRVRSVSKEKTDVKFDRVNGEIDVKLLVNTRDGERELVFEV